MNSSPSTRLSPVALEIWAYLSAHPEAQDTVEGIAEWWSLEQRAGKVTTEVKRALDDLVNHGLVLERSGRDRRVHYRLDPGKRSTASTSYPGSRPWLDQ